MKDKITTQRQVINTLKGQNSSYTRGICSCLETSMKDKITTQRQAINTLKGQNSSDTRE
jgi:hypothetical protein